MWFTSSSCCFYHLCKVSICNGLIKLDSTGQLGLFWHRSSSSDGCVGEIHVMLDWSTRCRDLKDSPFSAISSNSTSVKLVRFPCRIFRNHLNQMKSNPKLISEFLRIVHREWVEKHGPIYRGWGGSRAIVCISSPELMEVRISITS